MKIVEQSVKILDDKNYEDIIRKMERAARNCYKSKTSENFEDAEKFVGKLMKIGHGSIIEHETLTFEIVTNIGCSRQLIRHRLASFSEQSTRYVNLADVPVVVSPDFTEEEIDYVKNVCQVVEDNYKLFEKRDKARSVLPLCTATKIVVTMNFREIRHFLSLRLSERAHVDIRNLAQDMYDLLKKDYPLFVEYLEIQD